MRVKLRHLVVLTLLVTGGLSADVSASPRPSGTSAASWLWATNTLKTYRWDGGPVDSVVTYYVRYSRQGNGTRLISHVLLTDPGGHALHMWTRVCWNNCALRAWVCRYTLNNTWDSKPLNWTVRPGGYIKVWITNSSWDCTGVWGETWTGWVTIP
jgi:hypothetical protein